MQRNPYKSPEAPARPEISRRDRLGIAWALSLAAFFLGLPVGLFAVITGAHGGDAWPTIVFCAPVYLVATFVGDNLYYVATMVLGTGLMFGGYSFLLAMKSLRRGGFYVLGIHACSMLAVSLLFLL